MKKMKKGFKVMLILMFCFLSVCLYCNSGYYIRKHEWKHSQKKSFGDWIAFDETLYSLKWRTIYKNEKAVGKVIFCFESYLIVYVSNEDEGVGYYYKKR